MSKKKSNQLKEVNIPEVITIRELANRMAEQSSNIIKTPSWNGSHGDNKPFNRL